MIPEDKRAPSAEVLSAAARAVRALDGADWAKQDTRAEAPWRLARRLLWNIFAIEGYKFPGQGRLKKKGKGDDPYQYFVELRVLRGAELRLDKRVWPTASLDKHHFGSVDEIAMMSWAMGVMQSETPDASTGYVLVDGVTQFILTKDTGTLVYHRIRNGL